MKRMLMVLAVAAGTMAETAVWGGGEPIAQRQRLRMDAATLAAHPEKGWARAIVFDDVLESLPSGRAVSFHGQPYLPMQLKTAARAKSPCMPAPKSRVMSRLHIGCTSAAFVRLCVFP